MKALLLLVVLLLAGCSQVDTRLTKETVMAGRVVVEWPKGVTVDDVVTVPSGVEAGRVLSVAPVPVAAP